MNWIWLVGIAFLFDLIFSFFQGNFRVLVVILSSTNFPVQEKSGCLMPPMSMAEMEPTKWFTNPRLKYKMLAQLSQRQKA